MLYVFGECELDISLYTLRHAGQLIQLGPKVFQVLVYLLEHRDRVVSKDELCQQVWPKQFISDAAIESAIRLVRQAVGDSGQAQRCIQTLRGRGYRFVAMVDQDPQRPMEKRAGPVVVPEPVRHLHVDRETELRTLHDMFAQVEQRQGRVVGLAGPPGIGKSCLLATFRQSLHGRQVTYLEGHCHPHGQAIPYLPLYKIIAQLCGLTTADTSASVREKVQHSLQRVGLEAAVDSPYLLRLLGCPDEGQQPLRQRPETMKVRTFAILVRWLQLMSRQQPVILALEDLHCADPTTQDWLLALIESLPEAAILLLTTFAPAYRPPWSEVAAATILSLKPLTARESLRVVHAVLPPGRLPASVAQAMLARAGGNPLYLQLLAGLSAASTPPVSAHTLPDSLEEAIVLRFGCLSEPLRRLVQTAAVLGPVFALPWLQTVWEGPEELPTLLRELVEQELCSAQSVAGELYYSFTNPLIPAVVYQRLSPARCQTLHTVVAGALEAREASQSGAYGALLAYHYAQTSHAARAVQYLARSAEQAATCGAHVEALSMLDEALAHCEHLSGELRSGSCLRLLLAQAQARFALRRFQACMTSLEQARVYLATCEETASIARHALLWSQTASQLQEWERAVSSAMQAIATATSAHENRIVGQAYYELATARYRSGQLQQGLEDSQRAVHFLSLTPPSYWLGLAHVVLALHALLVGELPLALESTAHASTLGQSLGEPHLQVYAAWVTGWIEASRGEWEASIVACQQALAVAPDPLNTALSQGWLGYAYVKQGTPAAALPLLKQAILQTQQLQARRLEGLFTVVLAEACLLLNDLTMAHDLAHAGLAICTESAQRLGMAWAQRALGQIAQARGTLPAAAVYLQTALDLFAALPARCEVACTHFALATLGHQQHDPAATRTHLTAAYRLFHALRVPRYVEHTIQWARQVGLDHALELPR